MLGSLLVYFHQSPSENSSSLEDLEEKGKQIESETGKDKVNYFFLPCKGNLALLLLIEVKTHSDLTQKTAFSTEIEKFLSFCVNHRHLREIDYSLAVVGRLAAGAEWGGKSIHLPRI